MSCPENGSSSSKIYELDQGLVASKFNLNYQRSVRVCVYVCRS